MMISSICAGIEHSIKFINCMSKYSALFSRIGYEFKDLTLLKTALTHKSYSKNHNERLEFLGDVILSFVISDILYKLPNCFDEGDLSNCRAYLIMKDTLNELAEELQIEEFILTGINEKEHKKRSLSSIHANSIEAIIGAIYLDSSIEVCKEVVTKWYGSRVKKICPEYVKDPKTRLQEYAQARAYNLPKYSVIDIYGCEHDQTFKVSCTISDIEKISEGIGRSKRKAEQDAAKKFLEIVENE